MCCVLCVVCWSAVQWCAMPGRGARAGTMPPRLMTPSLLLPRLPLPNYKPFASLPLSLPLPPALTLRLLARRLQQRCSSQPLPSSLLGAWVLAGSPPPTTSCPGHLDLCALDGFGHLLLLPPLPASLAALKEAKRGGGGGERARMTWQSHSTPRVARWRSRTRTLPPLSAPPPPPPP